MTLQVPRGLSGETGRLWGSIDTQWGDRQALGRESKGVAGSGLWLLPEPEPDTCREAAGPLGRPLTGDGPGAVTGQESPAGLTAQRRQGLLVHLHYLTEVPPTLWVSTQGTKGHDPGDTALTSDPRYVLTPKCPRAAQSLPMQAGCTPLHAPSAWQVLRGEPTRTKGGRHWKETSDL